MVKNPNGQEANQLAIYNRDRGVKLGSIEKQIQWSERDVNPQSLELRSSALTTRLRRFLPQSWVSPALIDNNNNNKQHRTQSPKKVFSI